MLTHLGRAAREAREAAGRTQMNVAVAAGVSHVVISRLERGTRWPRDPDRVLAGYEAECEVSASELWRRAINAKDPRP